MTSFTMEQTTVTSTDGDLRAGIWVPDNVGPRPGIVLVDGSGESLFDDWGEWIDRYVGCGAVVMAHDKPGCGGSPGDWTTQTFEDRAADSLAALATLRKHPSVAGQPIGFLGVSQGGWISLLAAATDPAGPDFVVTMSGPGITPAAQEYYRIKTTLTAAGFAEPDVAEALSWITERTDRLRAGESPETVVAGQEAYADRSWYEMTTTYVDSAEVLGFVARIMDFDPAPYLSTRAVPGLRRVRRSRHAGAGRREHPGLPRSTLNWDFGNLHSLAVFPGGNHGLFTADPDPAMPRTSQLAPGYLRDGRRIPAAVSDR